MGGRAGVCPYLEVCEELAQRHFLPVGLQPLNLKAVPQRPLHLVVLRGTATART
mgnify:CR=1 FL=1